MSKLSQYSIPKVTLLRCYHVFHIKNLKHNKRVSSQSSEVCCPIRKIFFWIILVYFERVKITGIHGACYCGQAWWWESSVCQPHPVQTSKPDIVLQDVQRRSLSG